MAVEEAAHYADDHEPFDAPRRTRLGLPPGRRIPLEGRGDSFYREVDGPPGAPTVVLLHGWTASGGLNWFQCFASLAKHFRVIAPDLRGHGRGMKPWSRFRLSDCADDTAQLLRQLEIKNAVFVGYSMGGLVAQLLWKRHPDIVAGIVMSATSHNLVVGEREKFLLTTWMSALAGTTLVGQLTAFLPRAIASSMLPKTRASRPGSLARWSALEMGRHDFRMLMEAGYAIGRYDASEWIGDIDVPTAMLITTRDNACSPELQLKTAWEIPGTSIHRIEDGHTACATPAYARSLLKAVRDVARKAYPHHDFWNDSRD